MKKSLKIMTFSAFILIFAGCSNGNHSSVEMADLKASVEAARAAAVHADQTAQQALDIATQNSKKINNVWRKSQLK